MIQAPQPAWAFNPDADPDYRHKFTDTCRICPSGSSHTVVLKAETFSSSVAAKAPWRLEWRFSIDQEE